MEYGRLAENVTVSGQITPADVATLKDMGVDVIVCNRPDGESSDQPEFSIIKAAADQQGIKTAFIPFSGSGLSYQHVDAFREVLNEGGTIHMYCRTGNRCTVLWNTTQSLSAEESASKKADAGSATQHFDVVIAGAGSAGISVASGLLKRDRTLRVALIDPSENHYYQPGWTMVGGGVFHAETTRKSTSYLVPRGCTWLKASVSGFAPDSNEVIISTGARVSYDHLVVALGLKLNWAGVEGLEETLGKNGVTSNYRYDLAPYTWQLTQSLQKGTALFTQPPMPIKCAGAPQKAMYLSASHWEQHQRIDDIDIKFLTSTPSIFGVADYVPQLESYLARYNVDFKPTYTLTRVDGEKQIATFKTSDEHGDATTVDYHFDMLHVCPPQCAPDVIKDSSLADDAGWLSVNPETLQHTAHNNIWGLGDVTNTPNAKTMAAVRKQVPVVCDNLIAATRDERLTGAYDGYGSCPLTVERGKILLAEFGYGGKLKPTFPSWINNGLKPTRFAWWLKSRALPWVYWQLMLKGHEILTKCKK